ncbi:CaiB/BaiF CoA transferase family protein [Sphingobium aromaticiconvertens]|uniref:CaiB/BaiF CoA transferase family protein n=1 Tax=Sphingobium aromaticiconvertens TaxID=365341 RepID=UPI003018143D
MTRYDLLKGVTVVEVAQLGPSALGGHLADMGARVIKVEQPPLGDPIRHNGAMAIGDPEGVGFLHLRWNRGKESIAIDLHDPDGAALFRQIAASADIVIDGQRAGALDRLGLGFDALRSARADLVFCSLSGFGLSGPYHALGSHAPAFDAFGGLARIAPDERPGEGPVQPAIGMYAMGLYAAMGVLAALTRARATGEGALIEVAAADAAANWSADTVDAALNADRCMPRAGFADSEGRMFHWPRMAQYAAQDGKVIFFQAYKDKFWTRFCDAIDRPDLLAMKAGPDGPAAYHERLWSSLKAIFRTRDRAEWLALFADEAIPGHPANRPDEVAQDPHFLARGCFYDSQSPAMGPLRLTGTAVKIWGQAFAPDPAPAMGQHSDALIAEFAPALIQQMTDLRARGVVA